MKYLNSFFKNIKELNLFGSNMSKESVFVSRIPVITELDLKKERAIIDSQKYKINEEDIDVRELNSITRPMIKDLFKGIADLESPHVSYFIDSIRKNFANNYKSEMVEVESWKHDEKGNLTDYGKLMHFLNRSEFLLDRRSCHNGVDHYFTLSRSTFQFARYIETKERLFAKVNQQSHESFSYSKVEDVLRGVYKIQKLPSFYKQLTENNDNNWFDYKKDEPKASKEINRHLNMMVEMGLMQRNGKMIRLNKNKILNVWLVNPEARVFQDIKIDVNTLQNERKKEIESKMSSPDSDERRIGHKEFHQDRKDRFRIKIKR